MRHQWVGICAVLVLMAAEDASGADLRTSNDAAKTIAGTAEFLRAVPKRFAILQRMDPARRRVTLLIEGESLPKVWQLTPDAEVKVAGWWGRLEDLHAGDRVWAWFKTDRGKQPVTVFMLADELSEQDMHGPGVTIEAVKGASLTLRPTKGASKVLATAQCEVYRDQGKAAIGDLRVGERVYVQSTGGKARLVLDGPAFEARRSRQKAALRERWVAEGLPGTVAFLHISGEMDFMLDHEGMRWGRSLKPGDRVSLQAQPPIPAVVKQVMPWRERTQLRLVVNGQDQADLKVGERLRLRITPPPRVVDESALPPDLGAARTREERIEWFLASIYCTCPIGGDGCTGNFYTLASCNPNGCGMPNMMRKVLAGKIDQGQTDKQIFEQLLKEKGSDLVRPRLHP